MIAIHVTLSKYTRQLTYVSGFIQIMKLVYDS